MVYFDGHCRACRSAARLIERLDWLGKFELMSFRHDDSFQRAGLTTAQLERAMHVVSGGRAYAGFAAVLAISLRLPLLWPLLPALWLADLTGVGATLYRFLADRRLIVADRTSCDAAVCSNPSAAANGATDGAGVG